MIITKIIGGLGNQMFQYAAGRALSLKSDTALALDISGFKNYKLHQGFEFPRIFNQSSEIASQLDVFKMLGWQSPIILQRILSRTPFASYRHKRFIAEPHFQYWSGINRLPTNCYLSGYWQSEKYFNDVSSQIRSDFAFRLPLENKNIELALKIAQTNSVSLHIRRGDYVSNQQATAKHGLCSLDYYRASIRYIAERIPQPNFFVFSDDIGWVKDNLNIDFSHEYVDHNHGAESYNDMRLMSMCQHHIIANSSFSWWGAWLNPSMEKIVIAPKKWFAVDVNTSDLYPDGWVSL